MCPAMDSSTWDTQNLEIFWSENASETTSLLLTYPQDCYLLYYSAKFFYNAKEILTNTGAQRVDETSLILGMPNEFFSKTHDLIVFIKWK
jgi:hypothetical protein